MGGYKINRQMIKKILISQPAPTSPKSPYYDIAAKYNVELVFRPFIKVESLMLREFLAQHINLLEYTAVVFTSRHAIDHYFNLAKQLRVNIPETMKYFCTTETVAHYIQKYVQFRKRKVFIGTSGKVDSLLPAMLKHKGERYFVPQSDVHDDKIKNLLDGGGLHHREGVMYRTVSNDFEDGEAFDYDVLIFFSPSGIQSLLKNFPQFEQGERGILTFGPTTTREAKEAGLRVDLEAPSPQYPSVTAALAAFISQHNG